MDGISQVAVSGSCCSFVAVTDRLVEGVLKQSDTEAYLWGRKAANKGLAKAEYAVGCKSSISPRQLYTKQIVQTTLRLVLESSKIWILPNDGTCAQLVCIFFFFRNSARSRLF